jgi:hypothetical protein
MENGYINLTPDYANIFDGFEREAKLQAKNILQTIHPPAFDGVDAWKESQVSILRTIQGLLSSVNLCAQCATTTGHIQRLRDLTLYCVKTVQEKADQIEASLEEEDGDEDS